MAYDIVPSVDENYRFPPQIQKNLMSNIGRVPDGTNIDNVRTAGVYELAGGGHTKTLINLPPNIVTGTLLVVDSGQSSGQMQTQIVYGNSSAGDWVRSVHDTSGTWGRWRSLSWDVRDIAGHTDLNTVTYPGVYTVSSSAVARTLKNTPGLSDAATIEVFSVKVENTFRVTQIVWGNGPSGSVYERHTIDTNNTFSPWVDMLGDSDTLWAQHVLRVDEFKRRRGGSIGTYGYGAVSFRFDHNWDEFIAPNGIASLVEKYNLATSMAVPAMEFDPSYNNYSSTGSFVEMQKWALEHGMELVSHSYTHGDAQSASELSKEICDSRDYLESQMPEIKIDVWAQPGTTPPSGVAQYGNMGPITSIKTMYQNRAGRMLLGNYAVVGGHMGGYHQELTGEPSQACAHHTIETETTAQPTIDLINRASRSGTGLVLMVHPNNIGLRSGYMSLSVLEEIFAHVANLRDQGKIQNLTVGGIALADSCSERRRDLCYNGRFLEGGDGWTNDTTWSFSNGKAITSGTTALSQGEYWSRRASICGSWQELVVDATVSASTVVELRVWDQRDTSVLNFSKNFTLGSGSRRTIRLPFGIPYKNGAGVPTVHPTWSIRRVSGGTLTLDSVRVQAI